jgi:hypothetical protein
MGTVITIVIGIGIACWIVYEVYDAPEVDGGGNIINDNEIEEDDN